jgi:hypothetical protein
MENPPLVRGSLGRSEDLEGAFLPERRGEILR